MKEYKGLVGRILSNGQQRDDRTGKGTLAVFGEVIELDISERFPLVTLREIDFKQALGEFIGFIRGYDLVSEFKSVGCNYWDKFAKNEQGYLGPIYGVQWRNWGWTDQLYGLIEQIKTNPDSRRHILSTWNVSALDNMCLPPCHIIAQFDVFNDKLSCIVYMRSVDVMLGLPYDLAVYGLLTHTIAKLTKLKPNKLIFMMGNTHIYLPHVMDAIRIEKLEPKQSPILVSTIKDLESIGPENYQLVDYNPHPPVKFELFV